jgi:prolipoprotein diacylglyceryltransferase
MLSLLLFLPVLLGFMFWVWMLADCAANEPDEGNTKLVWVIIIIFASIVGAAVYYYVRRPQRCYSQQSKDTPL